MDKKFCEAIDPIFSAVFHYLRRIDAKNYDVTFQEARGNLKQLLDSAEQKLGKSEEWLSAKYALCCWIDEMFVYSKWTEAGYWQQKFLEMSEFGKARAFHDFFVEASNASACSYNNALEVFYLCAVLGFEGPYRSGDNAAKVDTMKQLDLPAKKEEWCRKLAGSIKVRQQLPAVQENVRPIHGNDLLVAKQQLVSSAVLSVVLVGLAIVGWFIAWARYNEKGGKVEGATSFAAYELKNS